MVNPASNPQTDWRQLYPFTSRHAVVGGCRMHYLDEGKGDTVVLLHGNPTWSFFYRNLVLDLRRDHRVIVPDHIGCGLSDKPARYSYRLRQHVDNLDELLTARLGLASVSLVLHDWGGAIGMGYAVRDPARIRSMVVMNTAAFRVPRCPWRIRICRLPLFGSLAVRGCNGFVRAALRMAVTAPLPPAVRAGYLAPYGSWPERIAVLRFVQDIPLHPRHPTWPTLTDMETRLDRLAGKPMLICWAGRDFCFTQEFLREWQQRFPHATVRLFPDAGHYILEDAGTKVNAECRRFLASVVEGGFR